MSEKYPRTPHLPYSPGGTRDDRRMESVDSLLNVPLIMTEKLDGSNLCMTREAVFARSHSGAPGHPSFDAAKALHARIKEDIDPCISVFGEWCYAVHSIRYEAVPAPPFFVFGVREDLTGHWWSWEDTVLQAQMLGLPTPPVLTFSRAILSAPMLQVWVEEALKIHGGRSVFGGEMEGAVVRLSPCFNDVSLSVAKYVRAGHVQTDEHWTAKSVERQPLVYLTEARGL